MSAPEDFFSKKDGFLVKRMAKHVAPGLAIGPDGDFWLYRHGVFRPAPDEVRDRMTHALGNRYRRGLVDHVKDMLHSFALPEIPSSPDYGAWHPTVNLRNGVYNWQTRTFTGHAPEHLSTVQLNVTYDSLALKAPKFQAWLDEVLPGDMQEMFWEFLGYLLMVGNPLHLAFLLHGPGGTGKSTALRVLEHLLGRENISAQSLKALTENRFAPASLFMKQANILGDIDAGYMRDSSLFKAITGGDTFTAERKYRDGFEFRPFAVPVFSANKTWISSDDTSGYFRRWVILPFTTKVDRSQPFDETELYAESSAIFNIAMGALRDLHARGHFDIRGTAREASEEFQQESDPLRYWLAEDESLTVDRGNQSLRSHRTELHQRYLTWADLNRYKHEKDAGAFYKSLRALGYEFKDSNGKRYVLGISQYVPGMAGVGR